MQQGLHDPAASRLYYAAYQAAVARLESQGFKATDFTAGAWRWEHRTVIHNASRCRGVRSDRRLLEMACHLRVKADYNPKGVEPGELAERLRDVEPFVLDLTR